MSDPRLDRTEKGALRMKGIPEPLAYAILWLPRLLSDDAPGIGKRMQISPYPEDEEDSREWARHAGPDLRHLFVSARAVVLEDLEGFEKDKRGRWGIEIPAGHEHAWLSAIAAARVALGDAQELDVSDMARPLQELEATERDRAVYLVHLLGWMQALLVGAEASE